MMPTSPPILWYDRAAKDWNEALPLGNGRIGAMAFSGVQEELFQFNEDTLWSGRPHNYIASNAGEDLAKVRQLIFDGHASEAEHLLRHSMMGAPEMQQAYQPLGDLKITLAEDLSSDGYHRELRLIEGVLSSRCGTSKNPKLLRESFVSHPHQVFVHRISRPQQTVSLTVAFTSPHPSEHLKESDGRFVVRGQWFGSGKSEGLQSGVEGGGLKFSVGVEVVLDGGSVTYLDGALHVTDANACTILLGAGTSFVNYQRTDGDPDRRWRVALETARHVGYNGLRKAHTKDFSGFMSRMSIVIEQANRDLEPTDTRLRKLAEGTPDPGLLAIYAQFGRYLLLSSSRPQTQPANLQGIWNKDKVPAWGSKWTTNINTQMNYWAAESANLAECHVPLFDLLDDLRVTGSATARAYYGCGGWVLHHNADLWRGAAAVDGPWGVWPMGAAWMARHPWEHYQFSGDVKFLRSRAWPIMRGALEFVLDFLIEAPKGNRFEGHLVTNPSHSPENSFRMLDGKVATLTYAATMDLAIITDLLENCAAAIAVLGAGGTEFEAELLKRIKFTQQHLAPIQIDGHTQRLQEWIEPFDEPEPGHRHMSHLYGLHPGHMIGVRSTPALAQAVENSLNYRLKSGGGGTGWSRAWVACFFARLEQPDHALQHLKLLLTKSTLPNMFDNHPPFQIDGNFGGCSAIIELLLQSHLGEIHLLPALPSEWPSGKATGLRARGGFTIALTWEDKLLVRAEVASRGRANCQLRYKDQTVVVSFSAEGLKSFEIDAVGKLVESASTDGV